MRNQLSELFWVDRGPGAARSNFRCGVRTSFGLRGCARLKRYARSAGLRLGLSLVAPVGLLSRNILTCRGLLLRTRHRADALKLRGDCEYPLCMVVHCSAVVATGVRELH